MFWHEVRDITGGNNEPKFDMLTRFMCDLLVLLLTVLKDEFYKDQ